MASEPTTTRHAGHALRGSDNAWSRRRLEAGLSIRQLAKKAGLPASIVGLIDQGRLMPGYEEASALAAALADQP